MKNFIKTNTGIITGIVRIMLGIIFLMTGLMKLFLSDYAAAWSIQLQEASIPLYAFNYWFVPIFEVVLGAALLVGYYSRITAAMILPIMFVAIYVHLTVSHPGAFPSQPQAPVMPVMVIVMALMVIVKGGGKWSRDARLYSQP